MKTKTGICISLIVCLLLAGAASTPADYVGYAVVKDGEVPLPEALDDVNDKHLITVDWGEYAGPKVRAAVLEVDNTSGMSSWKHSGGGDGAYYSEQVDFGQQVPVNGIEAMITDSLQRTGRFRLVERTEVADVIAEQDLATAGRVSQPSAAKTGKILGAEYLMQAVITSYEPNVKGKKGGLGGITRGLLGGVKAGKSKSMVGMNFRLIDAETSEILFTKQIDVWVSSNELDLGGMGWGASGAVGGFISSYSTTPIGQAVMSGINQGVFELIKQIGSAPLEGSVIKADAGGVFVNLGEGVLQPGAVLEAVSKGEELIDPETGLSLGGDEEVIGTLKVTEVKEKYSVTEPVDFDVAVLARGDKVVSTAEPAPLEFATAWTGPGAKKKK